MTRTSKPQVTPKPLPSPLVMSAAPMEPTPSPIPIRSPSLVRKREGSEDDNARDGKGLETAIQEIEEDISRLESRRATLELLRPNPNPHFPVPRLRLEILDLAHPGAEIFFANSTPTTALSEAVAAVLSILYEPTRNNKHIPPTRSVTLILRSMDGVAYTTSSDIGEDDKRIHFSLNYIHDLAKRARQPEEPKAEIQGVLVHEMVHCWQWNALGSAPGGLIEGIADFVRLKSGLSPPHWKREAGGKWDAGYQQTGYFLEWIETQEGEGSVRKINKALRNTDYEEDKFWNQLFGKQVTELWKDYSKSLEDESTRQSRREGRVRQVSPVGESDCVVGENSDERHEET